MARWADARHRIYIPQGVALGWENGWAFGPLIAATIGTKLTSENHPLFVENRQVFSSPHSEAVIISSGDANIYAGSLTAGEHTRIFVPHAS